MAELLNKAALGRLTRTEWVALKNHYERQEGICRLAATAVSRPAPVVYRDVVKDRELTTPPNRDYIDAHVWVGPDGHLVEAHDGHTPEKPSHGLARLNRLFGPQRLPWWKRLLRMKK